MHTVLPASLLSKPAHHSPWSGGLVSQSVHFPIYKAGVIISSGLPGWLWGVNAMIHRKGSAQRLTFARFSLHINSNNNDFFFFLLFGAASMAYGNSQARVESELQWPAYATATAMLDLSHICDLHCSSRQYQILSPLSEARD